MKWLRRLAPVLTIFLAAGCGSDQPKLPTYPVSGQVTYNGKAAAGVKVFLFPTSAPTLPQVPNHPHGVTGPDGRFVISTYSEGDGAPEGGYQVLLHWPVESAEELEQSADDQLFGWYTVAHSKLTAEVKPGENVLPPFNLPLRKGPPESLQGIPGRN